MLVARNLNGSLTISVLVNGYLFTRTYYDYSRGEAVKYFKEDLERAKKQSEEE